MTALRSWHGSPGAWLALAVVALLSYSPGARGGVAAMFSPEQELRRLATESTARDRCAPGAEGVSRALLVADDSKPTPHLDRDRFPGPLNDVRLLARALATAGIPASDIAKLENPDPDAVVAALQSLLEATRCRDRVFLQYAGFGTPEHLGGARSLVGLSTFRAVVNALRNIGAAVTVVYDAPLEAGFLGFEARWSAPGLWSPTVDVPAVQPGSGSLAAFYTALPFEKELDGRQHGILSYAFASVVAATPNVTVREVAEAVFSIVQKTTPGARVRFEASDPRRPLFAAAAAAPTFRVQIDEPKPPGGARGERGIAIITTETVRLKGHIEPPAALSWVTVQGSPASIAGNGRFERDIQLQPGKNTVYVVAAVRDGGEDPVPVATTVEVQYERAPRGLSQGRRFALLIAEQQYTKLDALKTPERDVTELAGILKSGYGFATELPPQDGASQSLVLLNQDKAYIFHVFYALGRAVHEEDSVVVYFAGHGTRDENGIAYWKSVKAGRDPDEESIGTLELQQVLLGIKARHVLLITDSCYGGRMTKRVPDPAPEVRTERDRRKYLETQASRRSRMFLSSGQDEPVDDQKGSGHSVFSAALLSALGTMKALEFTIDELFNEMRIPESVNAKADQVPDLRPIPDSGHEGGRMVFVRADGKG